MLAFDFSGVNDAVTALLVVVSAAIFRALYSMQERISRLEALDEMRERQLAKDRERETLSSDGKNTIRGMKEDT